MGVRHCLWRVGRRPFLVWAALAVLVQPFVSPVEAQEKTFVYAQEGAPDSLDPAKAASIRSIHVTWHVCDALIDISKDGRSLEPRLAESWTLSDGGSQAIVKLRAGVRFHDDTPVDAEAVKASIERMFRPSHQLYSATPKNAKEGLLGELIEDIQVQDEHTLLFKLKYPGFQYLSQVEIASPAAVAKLGTNFGRSPVCSGPFKFESWSEDRIVLTPNTQYWGGRPRIDRLVFRFIPGGEETVEALVDGDVHFVPYISDPAYFERLRESPGVELVQIPGLTIDYLGFYTERPPFDSPVLRRAIVAGIDVPRAVLFLGRGSIVAANGPLSPAMTGFDPTVSQPPYDPAAAKALLAEAGVSENLTVRLVHNSSFTFMAELAETIRRDLEKIGIRVELVGKPNWPDVVKAVREREGDMFVYGWKIRAPYPERLLVPLFHSRGVGATNLTHYKNPVVDQLLDQVSHLPVGAEQDKLYAQIQKRIVDDAPMLFLYHRVWVSAHADRVRNLELNLGVLPHDKLVEVDLAP